MPRITVSQASPFVSGRRELAARLAELAHRAREALHGEFAADNGPGLWRALRQACPPRATSRSSAAGLADQAAQTLVYGLFAAACYHDGPQPFTLRAARSTLGETNPFARELLRHLDGNRRRASVACRRPIQALLDLLGNVAHHTRGTDPALIQRCHEIVVHFYEDFLRAYDPKARGACGVYYTPEPVVSFMTRSVNHLLKKRLGRKRGLGDPGVCILDPACGTGAFLCAVANQVRAELSGCMDAETWPQYARQQLIPRLIGLEKLPAPCTIAQLVLRGRLFAGGDAQVGNTPLNIHLADALNDSELRQSACQAFLSGPERKTPLLIVLGNPPYSGISENRGCWIDDLLRGRLPDGSTGASYYHVDGEPLGEKKVWLQDDYVKFMRLGQWFIERAGAGILALVTNHAWLDNPTFRGLRRSLMQSFSEVYVIDLHGNANKKETCPDGSPDENVFDIRQGVAIGLFVRGPRRSGAAGVRHAELWGVRGAKLKRLSRAHIGRTRFEQINPSPPFYFFIPRDEKLRSEYERCRRIIDIMPVYATGMVTARDHFVTDFDAETLLQRMAEFRSTRNSGATIREKYFAGKGSPKYPPGDTRGWKLAQARRRVRNDKKWRRRTVPCLYRPFDKRPLYYVPWMVDWPRAEVMGHLQASENLALITVRQVAEGPFNHALVTDTITDGRVTLSNKGIAYVFPLYLYDAPRSSRGQAILSPKRQRWARGAREGRPGQLRLPTQGAERTPHSSPRRPNLNPEFVNELSDRMQLRFIPDGSGDLKRTTGPLDLFHYVYAILHSPSYRSRYAAFLQSDFPRIALPGDRASFRRLTRIGRELCTLHLLQHPALDEPMVEFPVDGSKVVAPGYPRYAPAGQPDPYDPKHRLLKKGRVYINKPDPKRGRPAQYFEGITPEMWNYRLCGYQPCRKWLADRRRRTLSPADLAHYRRVATAIHHTHRLTHKE